MPDDEGAGADGPGRPHAAGTAAGLRRGRGAAPILDERRIQAELPELPRELAGTEVAFLSDLQVGMWANTGMVEQAVAAVVEAEPDAVLLGGDFVYSHSPTSAPRSRR